MKRTTFAIATLLSFASITSGTAAAGEIKDELAAIKARLKQLENQVEKQNDTIQHQQDIIENKSKQIEALAEVTETKQNNSGGNAWFNKVEISGLVEVEAGHNNPDEGDDSSDVVLATAEIGIAAEINDWVSSEIVLLYEEDETDLEVDVATVTIANPDGPWYITGGQTYVPFGVFETNLISDPLTLEIGETRESVVLAGA